MAMHRAADKGPPSAVEALLGAGAEVDPTNKVRERCVWGRRVFFHVLAHSDFS